MAESIVNVAIEAIGRMLIEETNFLHGVTDQVEQLQLELRRLQSFLKDADARQNDDEMIKECVSQTRDLAYEAEDLIEGYAFRIAARKGNILKRCVCILNECAIRHSIGAEIQTLKSKIANLTRSLQEHGLTRSEGEGSPYSLVQQLRRTFSHVVEDDFIGLERDVEILVEHLVNESDARRHRVVSIYGMGGSGKTTLARKVYNHPKMKQYFVGFAWVCVSQKWQTRDILQGILIKFIPHQREEIQKWRYEELIRELRLIQQDNKYLVVLDDIWSVDAWNCIKEAFPIKDDGSKILVTTRIKDVAMQIEPAGFHHQQQLLNDHESWELLRLKTLKQIQDQDPENMDKMEELGKEMAKHCGGLPLAVVVLGGILATRYDLNDWETVQKNVKAYLGRGKNIENQGEVHKILELSYNDLPHKLKHCFLYLSRYPEDSDIDVETLYQLWMAEGLISVKDRIGEESMMDVAHRHLVDLAERSIVQVNVNENMPTDLRLHDLVRDLCLRKAKEENFLLLVSSQNGFCDDEVYSSSSSTGQIHRLVINFPSGDVPTYVSPSKSVTRHLRSLKLICLDRWDGKRLPRIVKSQLSWFRRLRVLEIENLSPQPETFKEYFLCLWDHRKLSEVVGTLIHLRYFSMKGSFFVCLPSSLGNLRYLQTINLNAYILRIPNVLWKMRQLRHLYLPYWDMLNPLGNKLRLDGLDKLEILDGFDNKKCHTRDLRKLTNLRALKAEVYVGYNDIIEIATFISNSNSLNSAMLHVKFPDEESLAGEKCVAVVTKLFSCRNLSDLSMSNPIGNLPKFEAGFASDLISVHLTSSEIKEDPMETLERLPKLQFLRLSYFSFLGTEMHCRAGGFPQLKKLELGNLPNLEKWIVAEGAMPNISSIEIDSCLGLEKIPDGFRFMTTLKELEVFGMPFEFVRRLQVIEGEEGEDFDKIRHVPLVKVITM